MIVTKPKELQEILKNLGDEKKIFLVGCGLCSTTCETGGEKEVLKMKEALEKEGPLPAGWYRKRRAWQLRQRSLL